MKKLNEAITAFGNFVWSSLYATAGLLAFAVLVIWLSRHVTCWNLLDKVCIIY